MSSTLRNELDCVSSNSSGSYRETSCIRARLNINSNICNADPSDICNYYIVDSNLKNMNPESSSANIMKITLRLSERHSTQMKVSNNSASLDDIERSSLFLAECKQKEAKVTPNISDYRSQIVQQPLFQKYDGTSFPKPVFQQQIVKENTKNLTGTSAFEVPPKRKRLNGITNSFEKARNISSLRIASGHQGMERVQTHVSVIANNMPCREKEFENIYNFLKCRIRDQTGGCMYISGVPGTGKTAIVTSVIQALKTSSDDQMLPTFEYLRINGMQLSEPRQVYVQIYKQLTGKTVSWEHARFLLNKIFTTPMARAYTVILLVDELDMLCNRRQDVIYNLLDWPAKSAAHLVVITIANTMDLPERLFMGKVSSRLGLTRITFPPYTYKQLQDIVTKRLEGSTVFKAEAVQLVARKVAAVSGDARRALEICRRATEIADGNMADEHAGSELVSVTHVQQALDEMITSPKLQAIHSCSRVEQLFLQGIVAEIKRTGVEENSFMGIYSQVESIAFMSMFNSLTTGRCLRACANLCAVRLLTSDHSRNDIFQKILLNVNIDDIQYAFRST